MESFKAENVLLITDTTETVQLKNDVYRKFYYYLGQFYKKYGYSEEDIKYP